MNSPTGRTMNLMPSEQYLKQSFVAQKQANQLRKAIIEAGGKIEGDVVDWSSTDFSQIERRIEARRKSLNNED